MMLCESVDIVCMNNTESKSIKTEQYNCSFTNILKFYNGFSYAHNKNHTCSVNNNTEKNQ